MKKLFTVVYPIVGTATIEVEAETSEEAIEQAPNVFDEKQHDVTWDFANPIVQGNVFLGEQNEASIEGEEEIEEE